MTKLSSGSRIDRSLGVIFRAGELIRRLHPPQEHVAASQPGRQLSLTVG
jgi:hypothetical protein